MRKAVQMKHCVCSYGDVLPSTQLEIFMCVLGMMLGVSCYTTVLGSVLSLVQSMDKQKQVYQDLVDSLNM